MAKTRRSYQGGAASTTTTTSIAASGTTTFVISAYTGWPYGTPPFFVVVEPGTSNEEKILVTRAGSTDTTINIYATPSVAANRGVDGTTAFLHASGSTVYPVFTATDADEANEMASTLTTQGDILIHGASTFGRVGIGTAAQVLRVNSGATAPEWGQVATAGIADDAITAAKIATGAVGADEIAANAVGASELADDAVDTASIVNLAVTTGKLADSAVTSAKIADGTIVDADINASAAITLSKLGTGALPTTITVASANLVDGTITGTDIAAGTITSSNIADGTITGTDIASGTVTSSNILDGTILNADINASAGIVDTKLATISTAGKVSNSATTATSANTGSAIVARDGSGNFSAGTITASTSGQHTGNQNGYVYSLGSSIGNDYQDAADFGSNPTTTSNGVLRVGNSTTGTTCITTNTSGANTYHLTFHYASNAIGSISTTTSTTSFNTSSDYRLKENVVPLADALAQIEMLQPKQYNFISEPDKTHHGFIAHELATVLPYAVTGEKDAVDDEGNIRPQQVDYSKLVGLLVGAIQELSARVKELENKQKETE